MTYDLTLFLGLRKPVKGTGEQFDSDIYAEDLGAIDTAVKANADAIAAFDPSVTAADITDSTATGRSLIKAVDASAALTTLGVSTFIKTLLDDAAASNARTTLGATTIGDALFVAASLAAARAQLATGYGTADASDANYLAATGVAAVDGAIYYKHSA